MTDIVIDLETMASGGPTGDSPEAQYKVNRVLHYGWWDCGAQTSTSIQPLLDLITTSPNPLIIGHNLKFDLKYLLREAPHIPWHMYRYYCTMHNEYTASGHYHKFSSLEDSCDRWIVSFTKGLDLGAILSSGIKMEDIPDSDLIPYLEEDVVATRRLFLEQATHVPVLGTCDHVLPLAHMELLGLPLDISTTEKIMRGLVNSETSLLTLLTTVVGQQLEWDDGTALKQGDIKVTAPRTISYLLTGEPSTGLVKGKKAAVFKSGSHPVMTAKQIQKYWPGVTPTNLGFPMPADTVEKILDVEFNGNYSYLSNLLFYRKTNKLMNTYIGPFLEAAKIQPSVHPKLHMVSTNTGRLSSAQPNGQNMPPRARICFKSRHGELREIDFKQLEVVALALVSQCPQLIDDIRRGGDIHYNTGRVVFGWHSPNDMDEKTRKLVKAVNFGLIYGGGPKGLSQSTGFDVATVKKLIKAFYARYPRVEEWQKEFYTEVCDNLEPHGIIQGQQCYQSTVTLPISGRQFTFIEKESPYWLQKKTGRIHSFKPTETKNYPIQGFAGGDIVMLALTHLYHELANTENTDIIMTVHDSILVDTVLTSTQLTAIMYTVCTKVESTFNMPFPLEFDITSGIYWQ